MTAVNFTRDDFDNLEIVRQIVLRRLKGDPDFNSFYQYWEGRAQQFVTFSEPQGMVMNKAPSCWGGYSMQVSHTTDVVQFPAEHGFGIGKGCRSRRSGQVAICLVEVDR